MKIVNITKPALKQIHKAPTYIYQKVLGWINAVETIGIASVRLRKGLHDEPLKGTRQGQRSVRLNQQWRLIYSETLEIIAIEEVTPHDYRTR